MLTSGPAIAESGGCFKRPAVIDRPMSNVADQSAADFHRRKSSLVVGGKIAATQWTIAMDRAAVARSIPDRHHRWPTTSLAPR